MDSMISFPETGPSDTVPDIIQLHFDSEPPRVRTNGNGDSDETSPLGGVRGVMPIAEEEQPEAPASGRFIWRVDHGAARNYRLLGQRLAKSGDLYRNKEDGHGLIQVLATGKARLISKGTQLAPVIVDRVLMRVEKEGKTVSELPTSAHLTAMLYSEEFLGQFIPVDEVTKTPFFLDNFTLAIGLRFSVWSRK